MSEYVEYLREVFELFGPVSARRMFGGHGLFHRGLMFGLVVRDALYLKADQHNLAYFEEEGLPPFSYSRQGRTATLSYFMAPDAIMEDRDEAAVWAARSFAAAQRADAVKRRSTSHKPAQTRQD